jgi:hypothetical protein
MSELRVFGNFALIVGQFILLFKSRQIGLLTLLLGSTLSLPYFLKQKQWDVVAVIVMGITLNLTGLFINPLSHLSEESDNRTTEAGFHSCSYRENTL